MKIVTILLLFFENRWYAICYNYFDNLLLIRLGFMMSKILIVDDEPNIQEDNKTYFESKGYDVVCAKNAAEAFTILSSAALDCIVLDIDLPDESGFDLCLKIRNTTGIPIIFLSGYTEEQSRIKGLSIGGDDYVCKPYSFEELELRIQARIRSYWHLQSPAKLSFGSLTIDPALRSVTYLDAVADLSTHEFDVLYLLALHPKQVYSYEQLFCQLWHEPIHKGIKSLQMIIVRLRQKLSVICPEHDYIQTIRRKGYFFSP